MTRNFTDLAPLDDVILGVNGSILKYKELQSVAEKENETPDGAQRIAIGFWSVSTTLTDFIFQLSEHLRAATTKYHLTYSDIANKDYSSAARAEQAAKTNPEFIKEKYNEAQKLQNYLDYVIAIKKDCDMAHYISKESYGRQTEMFLATNGHTT